MRTPRWYSNWPAVAIGTCLTALFVAGVYHVTSLDQSVALSAHSIIDLSELDRVTGVEEKRGTSSALTALFLSDFIYAPERGASVLHLIRNGYDDPTAGGDVPLQFVGNRQNEYISPHLRFRDLAARDGATLARIDPDLIDLLEILIIRSRAQVHILSGYRHPQRNAHPEVNGASHSQHMAGRAADLSSPDLTPLQLADVALREYGCTIGLGLGAQSLHVDVRGSLAHWSYDGAELDGPAFRDHVRSICGITDEDEDDGNQETTGETQRALAGEYALEDYVEIFSRQMRAFGRLQYRRGREGAVLLEINPSADASLSESYHLDFVYQDSPESRALGLDNLIATRQRATGLLVYVAIDPAGRVVKGVMSLDGH